MSYTLIICEKPSAANKIAYSLGGTKTVKKGHKTVPYYELVHKGERIIVGCAVGHLFTLAEKKHTTKWSYPIFDVHWVPTHTTSKAASFSKKYLETLKMLAKKADVCVNGCDWDIEGELIFRNILRLVCKKEDAKRMHFSTLTKPDLINAYENASPHLDFGLAEAGETRHFLDYIWGINASRALIISLKNAGGYRTLSTGRVQGPILNILEKREKEIKSFISTPFWELELAGLVKGQEILAFHAQGKFWKKEEAKKIFERCSGKDGTAESVNKREYKTNPPFPFDLTTLQREAYKNFGYSPKQTLDTAQTLYEQALISYPRTSSQKLPAKLGLKKILKELKKQKEYAEFCGKILGKKTIKPNEGPKKDSAHPSIYPTGSPPKALNPYQKKLYDMIVKRFLAVFAEPAVRERIKAVFNVEGEKFFSEGFRTIIPNWIDFYKPYAKFKEVLLPPIEEGDSIKNEKLELLDKETSPPSRFTQATVLREMEKLGLGTKGTRSGILQTLYDRGYIEEKSIAVTKLGEAVINALERHCKDIVSIELTRQFEKEMEAIQEGSKKREEIVKEARKTLEKTLKTFKENEKKIGEELLTGMREVMRQESTIGPCKCGSTLVVRKSRAGKRFVGCTGYPKCTETFSLPHKGYVKPISQKCECGLFIVSVKQFKKRPWKLCVRCGFKNTFKPKKTAGNAPPKIQPNKQNSGLKSPGTEK